MPQFKIAEDKITEYKKKLITRRLIIFVVLIFFTTIIGYFTAQTNIKEDDVNPLYYLVPLMIALYGYLFYKQKSTIDTIASSYLLTVEVNYIRREAAPLPPINLSINEIKQIVKNKNGGLMIFGSSTTDGIEVPPYIERYHEVESLLNDIVPIETKILNIRNFRIANNLIIGVAAICLLWAPNKIVVAISGGFIVVSMLVYFYQLSAARKLDENTKKNLWMYILVTIAFLVITLSKLME